MIQGFSLVFKLSSRSDNCYLSSVKFLSIVYDAFMVRNEMS